MDKDKILHVFIAAIQISRQLSQYIKSKDKTITWWVNYYVSENSTIYEKRAHKYIPIDEKIKVCFVKELKRDPYYDELYNVIYTPCYIIWVI